MDSVIVARAGDPEMDPEILDSMFRMRNDVFRGRLGWDIESSDGRERDEYDYFDPVYVICHHDRRVTGCARLLPTTGRYMLNEVFAPLLRGEEAPVRPRVWELSRFAIAPSAGNDRRQAGHSLTSFLLMQHAFAYAVRHGITSYVAVTSLSFERILRRVGVPMRRFGDGLAQRFGRDLAIALRIRLDNICRQAVHGELLTTNTLPKAA